MNQVWKQNICRTGASSAQIISLNKKQQSYDQECYQGCAGLAVAVSLRVAGPCQRLLYDNPLSSARLAVVAQMTARFVQGDRGLPVGWNLSAVIRP